ncbi:hypothetical protein, partial [Enterococcus casseliflavus]|uniref:hypothetical protein n=1 Tax=Enterococcus casseliflavus TaxID=37734 RepID=UPI003D098F94
GDLDPDQDQAVPEIDREAATVPGPPEISPDNLVGQLKNAIADQISLAADGGHHNGQERDKPDQSHQTQQNEQQGVLESSLKSHT